MKNKHHSRELAELTGIILGDGSIYLRKEKSKTSNRLKITLNSKDDSEYIIYVKNLLETIFESEPILKYRAGENTADLFIFKKEIILFLTDEIGLVPSPKWKRAKIPDCFMRKGLELLVLRGYFDTDGSLVTTNNNGIIYPRIEMKISPSPMQNQLIGILKKYKFRFGVYKIGKGKVRVQLNGKKQLRKWMSIVGSSNPKHLDKVKRFS